MKARLDNMAKSIQNLTISQQDHEIHDEATNMTVYREFEKMNTKLYELLSSTNKTFIKLLENMHSEITTITATESSDIQRLESQVSAHTSATSSNIGTIQTELHNLEDTLFRKLKPIGKCFSLLICYLCLKTGLLSYIVFIFIFITNITHDKSNFKTIRFRHNMI